MDIEALDPAEFQRQLGTTGKPAKSATPAEQSGGSNYYVQVGAFGSLENATALQGRLLELIYAPVIVARTDASTTIHRVQVGPFFTLEDADKVAAIIRDGQLGTPIVVKR
ncbi:MAG: SPOR domain-containing protein [Moraxellaceae bacterium]|nr:SPOR domain-containing protein [Moraxellaceae bacterium]